MDWLIEKVTLGQTIHKIKYHPAMRVYSVLVSTAMVATVAVSDHHDDGESTTTTTTTSAAIANDDDGASSAKSTGAGTDNKKDAREPGAFLPKVDRFSLLLISPVTWETVDRVDFDEFEQGLSLECVLLDSKQTSSGRKHFIAVGTGVMRGEDTPMKGSVSIKNRYYHDKRISMLILLGYIVFYRFMYTKSLKLCLNWIIHKRTTNSSFYTRKMSKAR